MTTVVAEFDGKVFLPQQPVELPVGTRVTVLLPAESGSLVGGPRRPTDDDRREREQFIAELRRTEPYFASVEEALGRSRKYPGFYP